MRTRAKFVVAEKTETSYGFRVKLTAVVGGSEEDKAFFKATPSGEITLQTVTDSTALGFKIGKSYYVDFTEFVEPEPEPELAPAISG